jgi:uncharacterized membrane protein
MIALKKEVFDTVKKEFKFIGILFLLALVIFKIAFFKEDLMILFRTVLSLFWLFALPGYFIMLYWKEKLEFTERFVVGIALSAAIIGILSYYIGLLGLNIKYHMFVLPLVLIVSGIVINMRKYAYFL